MYTKQTNSAVVVGGLIGSSETLEYTVSSSPVTPATPVCSAATVMQVLVSETAWVAVREHFEVRLLASMQPKGIAQPVRVFEVLRTLD